ncbi:MAG: CoB--CoM heterodisulfide reductase iron-sulfur subunit B family protein [Candidatus Jordarchaeaceae archaeon]
MSEGEFALFLGCTIPVRSLGYEISTRRVAKELGIKLVDLNFSCCGYPLKNVDVVAARAMAVGNLALAESKRLNVLTICSACAGTLTEACVNRDNPVGELVKKEIEKQGLSFNGTIWVKHFVRYLYEDYGIDKLKERVKVPLKNLRIAIHYGCHYLRPSEIYNEFDDPEHPVSVKKIIEALGATVVDYQGMLDCCGGATMTFNQKLGAILAKKKLDNVKKANVDALVLFCPFCSIMYDGHQKFIEEEFNCRPYNIPVLFLTQLIGLALGIDPKELGFDYNKVDVQPLLDKIGGKSE